jgi:hypothetical protein
MDAIPRHRLAVRRTSEQLVEAARRRASGQRDGKPTTGVTGKIGHPLCDAMRQRLRVF